MIYGEIFMNLERNSKRTAEISKLLFDTYKREIKIVNDSTKSVSFCQQTKISANGKAPFCMVYEPVLMIAVAPENNIDINSLDKIRTAFLKIYFKQGFDKTHPNLLFSFQDQMLKSGHLEAYNHWILMQGDQPAFNQWIAANKEKWDNFMQHFNGNGLKVDSSNRFYSAQY